MPHTESDTQDVLPIREIADRHPGEWVLIKILDSSMPMGDAPGIVLAHGDRKRMSKELAKAHKREPTALMSIMLGGSDQFGDGETLRKALARIAAEEEFVSVNSW